jgi:hypothetical protein
MAPIPPSLGLPINAVHLLSVLGTFLILAVLRSTVFPPWRTRQSMAKHPSMAVRPRNATSSTVRKEHTPFDPMRISTILNNEEQFDVQVESEEDLDDSASEAGSLSASSSSASTRRRESRKKYEGEQGYFIWYHRTDLQQCWDEVERKFDAHFGQNREKGGLQCKFYRILREHNVPKVREQGRPGQANAGVSKFGVMQQTNARFKWMYVFPNSCPR